MSEAALGIAIMSGQSAEAVCTAAIAVQRDRYVAGEIELDKFEASVERLLKNPGPDFL